MHNYITPEQARELMGGTAPGPWKADDIAGLILDQNGNRVADIETDGPGIAWIEWRTDADHALAAAAPDMARMIAGARVEYAIARKNDGVTEYLADWGWTDFRSTAEWHWSPPEYKPGPDERIITRLVIDLEEEQE